MELSEPGDLVTDEQLSAALLGAKQHAEAEQTGELAAPAGARPVQMHDVLPATPSGKIELFPSSLEKCSAAGLYNYIDDDTNGDRFPLALISPATRKTVNSSLGYLVKEQAVAMVHPADAAQRQIRDGDTIRVFNDRGEVFVEVNVGDSVAPGIVSLA